MKKSHFAVMVLSFSIAALALLVGHTDTGSGSQPPDGSVSEASGVILLSRPKRSLFRKALCCARRADAFPRIKQTAFRIPSSFRFYPPP